jgi:hypothetical protein
MLGVALGAVMVLAVSGMAMAQWGGPGQGQGYGPRGHMMGRGGGPCGNQQGGAAVPAATPIDEAKAKELAGEFVTKNLPGYQIEKIVKFDRPRGAMYQAEAKGPKGEIQYVHINPWGKVRTFGAGRAL